MCSINYWWFYLKGLANITIVWATNHFSWILVEEGWVILQLVEVTGYHSSIHNPHSSTIQYIFFLRNSHVRSSVRIRNHSLGLIDVPFSPENPFRYFSTSWKVPLRRARPTAMSRFSKWKEKGKKTSPNYHIEVIWIFWVWFLLTSPEEKWLLGMARLASVHSYNR